MEPALIATIQAAERELHVQIPVVDPGDMTTSSVQRAALLLANSLVKSTRLAAFVTSRAVVSSYQYPIKGRGRLDIDK